MAPRKSQVAKLIKLAEQHGAICEDNGWRASKESDCACNVFAAAMRNSSPEEIAQFERFYRPRDDKEAE